MIDLQCGGTRQRLRLLATDSETNRAIGTGLVKGCGGAASLLARVCVRIEAAEPLPGVLIVRGADVPRDRADVDVTANSLGVRDIGGA